MTSRDSTPSGGRDPSAGDAAPGATTPSSEDLAQRVRRLETALEAFFDALATTAQPHAAGGTGAAGSGPAAASTPSPRRGVEERLRWLERAVLRVQLEIGAMGAPGEPWDPDASAEELIKRRTDAHATTAPESTPAGRHWILDVLERLRAQELRLEWDDDDAWLEIDAPRAQAERLATRLLLERDGEALKQRGAQAGCWNAEGVLIGTGATADEAKQDAARRLGAAGVVTRLAARVEASSDAEAGELAAAILRRLDTMPWWEKLTVPEARGLVEAAARELHAPRGEPDDDEFAWLDAVRDPNEQDHCAEFERLGRWLIDRIGTLPPDESAVAIRQLDAALLEAGAPRARADALARRLLLERDAEALRRRGAQAGCWDFDGRLLGMGATCGDALRDAVANYGPEPDGVAWLTAELRNSSGDSDAPGGG